MPVRTLERLLRGERLQQGNVKLETSCTSLLSMPMDGGFEMTVEKEESCVCTWFNVAFDTIHALVRQGIKISNCVA